MANKEFNKEEFKQKMIELSAGRKAPLNESVSTKMATLLSWKKAADGRIYGIIKEHSKYFIKVSSKKENPNLTDFAYIGGLQNKMNEAYDNLGHAKNRLHTKMVILNESFGYPEEVDESDIPLNIEIDKDKEETAPAETPASTEVPASTETAPIEPSTEEPQVATDNAPAETSPEATTDNTETAIDSNVEPSADGQPEGDQESSTSEIHSLLGKITQKFGEIPEVDEKLAKTAINTTVSAVKNGLEKMDDKDKDQIIKRIENNGEKLDEELTEEETEEVIMALNENIKKGTINPLLERIIKKEYKKLQESKALENITKEELLEMIGDEDFEEPIDDKIDTNDCVITTDGSQYSITFNGKRIGNPFNDFDDAIEGVKTWREQNNNKNKVWFIDTDGSDREITDEFDNEDGVEEPAHIEDDYLINEIEKIAGNSKKLAIEYIKEKHSEKYNSMMNEDIYSLDEAALGDIFSKAGLSNLFNKAKSLFTSKQIDTLLQNQPEIARDVEEAKAILGTGDIDKWQAFKVKARKNIILVMLLLKLLGVGSPLFAQDYKTTVPDNIKAKIEMVKKDGDQTPKSGIQGDTQAVADSTLAKIIPAGKVTSSDGGKTFSYKKETEGQNGAINFQFSARGGDKTGPQVDVNNKNVEADSKEMEKKFQFIKDEVEKLGEVTPQQFQEAFGKIKSDFESRFANSELSLTKDGIVFTNKFNDNDNIAQSNYKTADGGIIKQGDKIQQGTTVVDILGAKIGETGKETPGRVEDKQVVSITNKKVTISKDVLSKIPQDRVAKANDLKEALTKAGFDIETDGNYIVINEQGFYVDSQNADKTISELNNWAKSTLGVDNMFSFSGQQMAQAQAK